MNYSYQRFVCSWKRNISSSIQILFVGQYDPRFGDAFWNSSRFSMMQYLYLMMTSWAIVCEVWYLPPMYQDEDESAIDFANRVKRVISRQGGLVDLMWLVPVNHLIEIILLLCSFCLLLNFFYRTFCTKLYTRSFINTAIFQNMILYT